MAFKDKLTTLERLLGELHTEAEHSEQDRKALHELLQKHEQQPESAPEAAWRCMLQVREYSFRR